MVTTFFVIHIWQQIYKIMSPEASEVKTIIAFLVFPTAFFLANLYTESIFVLLVGAYLLGFLKKRYALVILSGLLLGLTRLAGVMVCFIPVSVIIWQWVTQHKIEPIHLINTLAPFLGLGIYMFYLYLSTGNPLEFVTAQKQFNNGRSTTLILLPQVIWRYLKIFIIAKPDLLYFIAILEFAVLLFFSFLL